jgi:hypothetical protein
VFEYFLQIVLILLLEVALAVYKYREQSLPILVLFAWDVEMSNTSAPNVVKQYAWCAWSHFQVRSNALWSFGGGTSVLVFENSQVCSARD